MKKKILIVDDVVENIQLAANILTNEGYLVEYATNGLEALDWIENEDFDLMLLDVMMPDMDGFQVCKKVRENPNSSDLPIIFLSAITDKECTIKGLKAGAQDFATKPYNSGELLSRIETHIELSDARKKLKDINSILEEKVRERTLELENTMIELKIAKDKAEESSRLKSAFLANMSHEIRTPLNGILSFSEFIAYPDISEDEKKDCMVSLKNSSQRLISLVENIIDISMIDTGQMEIKKGICDLNEIMNGVYGIYKQQAADKGIHLNINLGSTDIDSIFESDGKRIHQIIDNLINNAVKFTIDGRIDFGYEALENEFKFYVIDTGIGITDVSLPFIFDRFRQVEYNYSRSYDGAGIGLSLVEGFIQLLGGKVWVESEVGKGSAFYFKLPKAG
jgi:signal transduction histidine kinase